MQRRKFLGLGTAGIGLVTGCTGQSDDQTTANRSPEGRSTIYVDPDGSDGNSGTEASPLRSIQAAIERARPGQTVTVRPGEYFESLRTVRPGTESAPITITGPPDAVLSGDREADSPPGFVIRHSHIHLTGLTVDGLRDPSSPDDVTSYLESGIKTQPADFEYLTDLKIMPHAIGNVEGNLVHVAWSENVEVGEFRVIGPAGLGYLLTDEPGYWGEIVYVGISPHMAAEEIEQKGDLEGLETSNDVHIHHIDNSEGHPHSELVNTKFGTYDVLVEYCTDGGGSQNTEESPAASVRLQSYGATVRWCNLRDGQGDGVYVGSWYAEDRRKESPESKLTDAERRGGRENEIYGNRVTGFAERAFRFPNRDVGQSPAAQTHFCGNEYTGSADGNPDESCPEGVPTGDGRGHLGGDSPWS